jgi:hypothetical protein
MFFSDPYFAAGQMVTVRQDNTDINSKNNLYLKRVLIGGDLRDGIRVGRGESDGSTTEGERGRRRVSDTRSYHNDSRQSDRSDECPRPGAASRCAPASATALRVQFATCSSLSDALFHEITLAVTSGQKEKPAARAFRGLSQRELVPREFWEKGLPIGCFNLPTLWGRC